MTSDSEKVLAQYLRLRDRAPETLSELDVERLARAEHELRDVTFIDALDFLVRSSMRLPRR